MPKSLRLRFAEEGINPEKIKAGILGKGLLPTARERRCSVEALRNYAEDILGISNPQYVTRDFTKSNEELCYDFIFAMYQMWKNNERTIEALRLQLREYERRDAERQQLAKNQLIEMIQATKVREIMALCRG